MIEIDAPKLLSFLDTEAERARQYRHDDDAANAIDFYNGEKFGNEEEGRSQVVTRDVAEVVDQATISILKTMVSGDKAVVFETEDDGEVDYGEQATEAIHYQFMRKQRPKGYRILHDIVKAGLLERWGIVKTVVERKYEVQSFSVPALALADEGFVYDYAEQTDEFDDAGYSDPEHGRIWKAYRKAPLPPVVRDIPVPLEEFFISPDARDLDTSPYVGHETGKTLSDLRELGFDIDETIFATLTDSPVSKARDRNRAQGSWTTTGAGKMVALREEYVRFDMDGDGVTELLCVSRVGGKILRIEALQNLKTVPIAAL